MNKVMLISVDCHATMPWDRYHDYIEPRFHAELDRWIDARRDAAAALVAPAFDPAAQWDDALRWTDLEADGVAAEVLFNQLSLPFEDGGRPPTDAELEKQGVAANNHFLADMIALAPARRTAHLSISLHDIDFSVEEIRKGYAAGARGVNLLPPHTGFPMYYHPRYEPIWDVCEELAMPVVAHGGVGNPSGDWRAGLGDLDDPDELAYFEKAAGTQLGPEFTWWARRMLWQLLFGGVFTRHPRLVGIVTESFTDWAPQLMDYLDWIHTDTNIQQVARLRRELCPDRPSDVIRRQVYFGSSSMTRSDFRAAQIVGTDRVMFGVDYPHVEGTTPHTKQWLQTVMGFSECSERDARKLLGENAALVYGFDTDALVPVVERIGPDLDEILSQEPVPDSAFPERLARQYLRPVGM